MTQINWHPWGGEAFAAASDVDRPILLSLTAVWCGWCRQMDATTYSDPAVIALINEQFIPIRVDADQYPHVHDRYIAGGWPTNAFLTPTGEVLWAGTFIPPEQLIQIATSVSAAWSERRDELAAEIERRRKALEAARGRIKSVGLVRREAADDVWSSVIDSFDARNGGFGTEPKYPTPDAIELVFVRAQDAPDQLHIAHQTLDGMLAGELWDPEEGGFFRYALASDWTQPQREKLLATNAGLLRAYALGASLAGNSAWRKTVEDTVDWADRTLRRADGLWAASSAADTLYTNVNADWITALAQAGSRLQRPDWVQQADAALSTLAERMRAPNQLFYHYAERDAAPQLPYLLLDACSVARACLTVGQAAGDRARIDQARAIVETLEKPLWADDGGFYDRTKTPHDVGVLRYRDRPFDLNAELARVLLDLAEALSERSFRALAERTLALLSPLAGRYSVGGACFALAVHDFFDEPTQFWVTGTGPAADALRRTALALPLPSRRVWPLPRGGRIGRNNFALLAEPAVYAAGPHGVSRPITDPAQLAEAAAHIR